MSRTGIIIASLGVLFFYLNYGKLQAHFDTDILETKTAPMEYIETLYEGKENVYMEPEITWNGNRVAYDREQNMILIPQNLSVENFEGNLKVQEGTLYFVKDEALSRKETVIEENKVSRLFWIKEDRWWMYNVYFTGMPVMNISAGINTDEQGVTYGTIEVSDPYHSSLGFQDSSGNWHLRGASTLYYEKKSYKLTLDKKVSLLGMRKDDDWILHALYDDDGLVHNMLSYEVWQEIAADNSVKNDEGIHMEYVEVFMDQEYLGVYGLSERIDKKALDLGDKDILYKGKNQNDFWEDDFYSELTKEMNPSFVWKYPQDFTMEDWNPLKRWTKHYCFGGIFNYEEGKALLNMENAIDYTLFNLLICGGDNIMKNIYFIADYQTDGSYQFIKIPWDLNMTWGNSWIDDPDCNNNRYQEKNITSSIGWTPDVEALYKKNPKEIGILLYSRWQQLRENIITKEVLYKKVDSLLGYLYASGAYTRNTQKWPAKGEYWSESYLYEYINKRIDFLDNYIKELTVGEENELQT